MFDVLVGRWRSYVRDDVWSASFLQPRSRKIVHAYFSRRSQIS